MYSLQGLCLDRRTTLCASGETRLRHPHHVSQTRAPGRCAALSGADGFVTEYELAGIKLDTATRTQLRNWYQGELERGRVPGRGAGGGNTPAPFDGPGSKALPPLPLPLPQPPRSRQPKPPQLTVLWDLESIRPFTQQHSTQAAPTEGPGAALSSSASGRVSRRAAAGLAAASSPDLVGALDQLCRTLQEYGAVHAVHLFFRQAALIKAPALGRQVEQLQTWIWAEGAEEELEEEQEAERAVGEQQGTAKAQEAEPSRASRDRPRAGGKAAGQRSQQPTGPAPAHDCPMCRSSYPTRLALLRHFTAAHQSPLLVATATDPRIQIMWTRGRPVMLPVSPPAGESAGHPANGLAADLHGEGASSPGPERVPISPQEFVYARELLMRGRHLDGLLAAAPPTVTSVPAAAGAAPAAGSGGGGGRGSGGRGSGGGAWSQPGLHLRMAPAGQAAGDVAAALLRAVEEMSLEKAAAVRAARVEMQAGRGRGRAGGRQVQLEEPPLECICLVSDAEGLDQALAGVRRRGLLTIALTRTARVTADASLRWWAVQGGEYRLEGRGPR